MDDAERERRNADAIGLYFRVKHALAGAAFTLVGVAVAAWLLSGAADATANGRGPGPWPWLAVAGCAVAGPLLFWKAVRGR